MTYFPLKIFTSNRASIERIYLVSCKTNSERISGVQRRLKVQFAESLLRHYFDFAKTFYRLTSFAQSVYYFSGTWLTKCKTGLISKVLPIPYVQ